MHIRAATPTDIAAILAIWNPVIRDSDMTFNSQEKTPTLLGEELGGKAKNTHPFLLACAGSDLLGFATYGQFRASNGYAHTMEHTIILAPDARGKGIGRSLIDALEAHARHHQVHSMIAGISHANTRGLAFHAACGYREIARLPEVGFKFNRWYDLILMQKRLSPLSGTAI